MKPTDFSKELSHFLSVYLPAQRNLSKNTIASYCDTFKLLFSFLTKEKHVSIESIQIKNINCQTIDSFLEWLEKNRHCSRSTINQRLACIHSFFRYLQASYPSSILNCQQVLSIPFRKRKIPCVNYLFSEDLKIILEQPNTRTARGRRDLVLLSLMYDTGARVQEIADLTVGSVRLEAPACVTLVGKGTKVRTVPLMSNTAQLVRQYLKEHGLGAPGSRDKPLFCNSQGHPLTRAGIAYILKKYANMARQVKITLPKNITPHVLRHSKAMHLLQAGVNIIYIRDILGHSDVNTTQTYARADLEMKRVALSKVNPIVPADIPKWMIDTNLLSWLTDYESSLKQT